ncbi:MAG: arsenate reductase ArsC [Planctomycetota bacterium]|nr:arsenate reductase ArsC [Planctomycetota bacterium]
MSEGSQGTVLFLCTGNSARSQMAEALLRNMDGHDLESISAGLEPNPEVHPLAIRAMARIGIDTSGQHPKDISKYLGRTMISYLIIVCDKAAKHCPTVWPGLSDRNRLVWPVEDPAKAEGTEEERLKVFCRVRDELKKKLEEWLESI